MCIGSLTSRVLRILKRVEGFAIDDEGEVYLPQKECALTSLAFMATIFRSLAQGKAKECRRPFNHRWGAIFLPYCRQRMRVKVMLLFFFSKAMMVAENKVPLL